MQPVKTPPNGVLIVAEAEHSANAYDKTLIGPGGFFMGRSLGMGRREWCIGAGGEPELRNLGPHSRDAFQWSFQEPGLGLYGPQVTAQIDAQKPGCIVALGEEAFQRLTGENLPIAAARGYAWRERTTGVWVVPTFHPQVLLKGQQHLMQAFLWDVDKAVDIAANGYAYEEIESLAHPPLVVWEHFIDTYLQRVAHDPTSVVLAGDVETPYKRSRAQSDEEVDAGEDITYNIDSASFAFEGKRGVTVPWAMPFTPGIARLIAGAPLMTWWNRPYDRPRVAKALSQDLPIHKHRDAMDAFHVLYNALPRKLGFATSCYPLGQRGVRAWKHLGSQDVLYQVWDACGLWRNDCDIQKLLKASGQQATYDLFCGALDPVLESATRGGMLVDAERRDRLSIEWRTLLESVEQRMDAVVPSEVKSVQGWKSLKAAEKGLALLMEKGEVGADAVLELVEATQEAQTCCACGAWPVRKDHSSRKTLKAEMELLEQMS